MAKKSSTPRLATAGLLGLTEFAASALLIVSISVALAGLALFAFVAWGQAAGGSGQLDVVAAAVERFGKIHEQLQALQFGLIVGVICLLLAALAYVSWRGRRAQYSALIEKEREAEFDALVEKAKDGSLPELPPTAEMLRATEIIDQLQTSIARIADENPDKSIDDLEPGQKAELERLLAERQQVAQARAFVDIIRRVEVGVDRSKLDLGAPKGWLGKVGTFFISRGLFNTFGGFGRALFVLSLMALVGGSVVAVGASNETATRLALAVDDLENIEIDLSAQDAAKTWREALAAAATEPPPPAEDTQSADGWCVDDSPECDETVLEQLAAGFEDAYARAAIRRLGVSTTTIPNRRGIAARTAILAEAAQRPVSLGVGLGDAPAHSIGVQDGAGNGLARLEAEDYLRTADQRVETPARKQFKEFLRTEMRDGNPAAWKSIKHKLAPYAAQFTQIPAKAAIQQELALRMMGALAELPPGDLPYGDALEESLRKAGVHKATFDIQSRMYAKDLLLGVAPDDVALRIEASADGATARSGVRASERATLQALAPEISYSNAPALIENRPPTLVRFEEAHVDFDRVRLAVDDYERAVTAGGRAAPQSIEAIAGFDDYFPGWRDGQPAGGGGGGGGGGAGPAKPRPIITEAALRPAQVAEVRSPAFKSSRSFFRLSGSRRIGGVLIGRAPTDDDVVLDFREMTWRSQGPDIVLSLKRGDGTVIDLPPADPEIVQLALVYAAEGRPIAATMTKATPLLELKIQLHPALVDTSLGCRAIEVDRYVDTYSGADPTVEQTRSAANDPLMLYNYAWARRNLALVARSAPTIVPESLSAQIVSYAERNANGILANQSTVAAAALAFERKGALFEPQSLLVSKPGYFDPNLVGSMNYCSSQATLEDFGACIADEAAADPRFDDETQRNAAVAPPPQYEVWSGVREREWSRDADLNFAGAGVRTTSPLEFMLQTAFATLPYFAPNVENWWEEDQPTLNDTVDESPWQFPSLDTRVDDVVRIAVATDAGRQDELRSIEEFVYLQRLFRAALDGKLGEQFPVQKLADLTIATRDGVTEVRTPRWNARTGLLELSFLSTTRSEIEEQRAGALADAAQSCVNAFIDLEPSALSKIPAEEWDSKCVFESIDEGTMELAAFSLETSKARALREALGVQKDDEAQLSRPAALPGQSICPSLVN
ncbi:hypothetical protein [Mesorhizobium sp. KR9-304]|uniref:hypothetical protein n=1 Tax=Mesorhizobium sp. KR9-304 TaxID=3156614 RepID=UPI0032B3AB53